MRNKKGFTLIELMIVVAIIGILAAIAIPMYTANVNKAKLQEAVDTLGAIKDEVSNYVADRGLWPEVPPEGSGNFNLANPVLIMNVLGVACPGLNDPNAKWTYLAQPGGLGYQITAVGLPPVGTYLTGQTVTCEGVWDALNAVFTSWSWTASAQIKPSWLPR